MKNHTCTGSTCQVCAKKKSMMFAIGAGIIIVGGIIIAMRSGGDTDDMTESATGEEVVVQSVGQDVRKGVGAGQGAVREVTATADVAQGGGAYVVYAPELIGKTERTILSFSATWCPSCQEFDKDIVARVADIPAGVTVLKVDYDTYSDLKKKYGIRSQHTFVEVDKNGAPLKTVVGSANLAALITDFAL